MGECTTPHHTKRNETKRNETNTTQMSILRQAVRTLGARSSLLRSTAVGAYSQTTSVVVMPQVNKPFGTAAAGAEGTTAYNVGSSSNIKWHESNVTREVRQNIINQKGCVLWFTGLSGSGKSTLAYTVEHALAERGKLAYVLDGDNIRHGLCKNLSFSAEDREENIRRIGEVSKLYADTGVITLVSFISPYKKDRDAVRQLMPDGDFIEVFMKIPLAVCEDRDPKGLYKAARAGKIKGFTGIDDPYEEPVKPELTIQVSGEDGKLEAPAVMAAELISYLEGKGYLSK